MRALAFSLRSASELSSADIGAWHEIVAGDPALAGPYFSPAFTAAIARVRRDLEVALWRQGRDIVAVLPFHRRPLSIGYPVGGPLSDYQALIARPGFEIGADRVLADCRLDAFDYRYWLADRLPAGARYRESGFAPCLNLAHGFDAYVEGRRQAGVQELHKTFKKRRKLEREVGPVRFIAESLDPRLDAALVRWKGEQYRRTGHFQAFAIDWIAAVIGAIRQRSDEEFRGTMSALYAGDELVAVHLGMRTRTVWHYWLPAHDPAFAAYSPGMILALATAEHAASIGVRRIDLGKGDSRFKTALGSDAIRVDAGYFVAETPSPAVLLHKTRFALERGCERLPIGSIASWPRRLFNRIELRLERTYR